MAGMGSRGSCSKQRPLSHLRTCGMYPCCQLRKADQLAQLAETTSALGMPDLSHCTYASYFDPVIAVDFHARMNSSGYSIAFPRVAVFLTTSVVLQLGPDETGSEEDPDSEFSWLIAK
jgi:hypothetical protein